MTTCFYAVILCAVFLIEFSPRGLSLECHTCYSTKSWDDCLQHSRVVKCPISDDSVVCMKTFRRLHKNEQQFDEFAKSCFSKEQCDKEKCRQDLFNSKGVKAAHCDIHCCSEDRCNTGTAGLECHTCYSTKSWDDCLQHSRVVKCPTSDHSVVCMKTFRSKLLKNEQRFDEFAKSCFSKEQCDKEKCRQDLFNAKGVKAAHCDVHCCNEDRCNTGKAMAMRGAPLATLITFALMSSMAIRVID